MKLEVEVVERKSWVQFGIHLEDGESSVKEAKFNQKLQNVFQNANNFESQHLKMQMIDQNS